MPDLSGKIVVATGASKGIGAEIVRSLGSAGTSVAAQYATDREGSEAAVPDGGGCDNGAGRDDIHD